MSKPKLACSFSGGRTSAVMTKILLEEYSETHDIIVTFANTGCEHQDTLRFVDACDKNFGFNTVWLEAVITHGQRVGVRHKIVSYETASRNGEPFEEAIKKYGVFGPGHPQCTSRLKTEVMESYLRSKGFVRGKHINYDTAIGIRADETDRVSAKKNEYRFIYPLVDRGWTKQMVISYMKQYDWDLNIPEHYGNCVWCWKKSLRKLMTIAKESPSAFEFPARMEELYKHVHNGKEPQKKPRLFFRNHMSAKDIVKRSASEEFIPFDDPNFDSYKDFSRELDTNDGCSESCEVYPTDGT